jgi:hypothetical protein
MSNPFDNNLPNQVSAICDLLDRKPRIVQCIQACNEESLIEACMLQVYNKVDKIIVIEGAVQNKVEAGQATPDGHSLDRTVEIIKQVKETKDPDKKIIFVQIDRPWQHLEELKATFFQYMQDGDWMLITDADEFIFPEVVDDLRRAISIEPWATEFVPSAFFHFWRDAFHIRKPSGDWGQQHQRFIKFQQGLHYANHPVARDASGQCTYFSPQYLARRFVLPSFRVFHYSYCRLDASDIQKKKDFYLKELGQQKHGDIGAYARGGQTDEFASKSEDLNTVVRFDGLHPPIMATHPIVMRGQDEFLKTKEPLVSHMEVAPYNLKDIPLIWVWAHEGKAGYTKLFNTVEV